MSLIEQQPITDNTQYVILACRFYPELTAELISSARDTLLESKISSDNISLVDVAGAWELPVTASKLLATKKNIKAIIVVGAVIKGETTHFEHVATGATTGLQQVAIKYNIPISLGLITANNYEQAQSRAGGEHSNQGAVAAQSALEMVELFSNI
jgi:6,7-dimethyl-8-ribityllumazine synthase